MYLKLANTLGEIKPLAYKIMIEVEEEKMTSYELKQASRYISEALSKMGIDHAIECQMGKFRLFGITKNFLKLKEEKK